MNGLWPLNARYLIHKNRATRRKEYRALAEGRPLRRTQRTATGAMEYRRRIEMRLSALRAAASLPVTIPPANEPVIKRGSIVRRVIEFIYVFIISWFYRRMRPRP